MTSFTGPGWKVEIDQGMEFAATTGGIQLVQTRPTECSVTFENVSIQQAMELVKFYDPNWDARGAVSAAGPGDEPVSFDRFAGLDLG